MDKDVKRRELIETLKKLLAIDSTTGREQEILAFLSQYLEGLGFELSKEYVFNDRYNLIGIRGEPEYLIATHVDTVPTWDHPYTTEPKIEDTTIWARGVVDTKGQIAALLNAIKDDSNAPCAVAFFVDEEVGGQGSFKFHPPKKFKGAVVLEPTDLKIANKQAGSVEIVVECFGKCAHGAVPKKGDNAIDTFIEIYQTIKGLSYLKTTPKEFKDAGLTLGKLEGGIDCQIVPSRCVGELDIPIYSEKDKDELFSCLEDLKKRYNFNYTVVYMDMPCEISAEEGVVQYLAKAVKKEINLEFTGMCAWTDAANLMKKGIPSVIFGAGSLHTCHCPDERLDIDDLFKLYRIFINFFQG